MDWVASFRLADLSPRLIVALSDLICLYIPCKKKPGGYARLFSSHLKSPNIESGRP
jgi:hypothetical protein